MLLSARRPDGKNILPVMTWLPPVPVESLPLPCADAAAGQQSRITRIASFGTVSRCGKSRAGKENIGEPLLKNSQSISKAGGMIVKRKKKMGRDVILVASPRPGQYQPPVVGRRLLRLEGELRAKPERRGCLHEHCRPVEWVDHWRNARDAAIERKSLIQGHCT